MVSIHGFELARTISTEPNYYFLQKHLKNHAQLIVGFVAKLNFCFNYRSNNRTEQTHIINQIKRPKK